MYHVRDRPIGFCIGDNSCDLAGPVHYGSAVSCSARQCKPTRRRSLPRISNIVASSRPVWSGGSVVSRSQGQRRVPLSVAYIIPPRMDRCVHTSVQYVAYRTASRAARSRSATDCGADSDSRWLAASANHHTHDERDCDASLWSAECGPPTAIGVAHAARDTDRTTARRPMCGPPSGQ